MSIINEMIKSKQTYSNDHGNSDPYIASVSDKSFKINTFNPTVVALSSCITLLVLSSTYFLYHHYSKKNKASLISSSQVLSDSSPTVVTNKTNSSQLRLEASAKKVDDKAPIAKTALKPKKVDAINKQVSNQISTKPNNGFINNNASSKISSEELINSNQNNSSNELLSIDMSGSEQFYSERFLEIQEGRLFKAMIALNNIANNEELFVSTIIRLSSSLNEKGKFSESQTLVKSGLDHYPQKLSLITQLASSYMAAAKYQKGVEILEKYTPDFESHPDYYSLLAYSYLKTNRIRESINIYKQLVLFDPTNAPWWIGLGIAYQSHSQPKNALDAFRHAHRVSKEHAPYIEYIEKQISEISKDYIL